MLKLESLKCLKFSKIPQSSQQYLDLFLDLFMHLKAVVNQSNQFIKFYEYILKQSSSKQFWVNILEKFTKFKILFPNIFGKSGLKQIWLKKMFWYFFFSTKWRTGTLNHHFWIFFQTFFCIMFSVDFCLLKILICITLVIVQYLVTSVLNSMS